MKLEEATKLQNVFKSNLNKKSRGRYKSEKRMIFSIESEAKYKTIHETGVKMLTTKHMLQRLAVALAQVKAGNTSKNLLNKIRQIIYSLYRAKEITKIVYNNKTNSIKL